MKKIIAGISGGIVLVAASFILVFFVFDDGLKDALNSENYKTVQVKALMKNTYIGKDSLNNDMEGTPDSSETSSENTSSGDIQQSSEQQEITVMQKQGSVIYESGMSGKYYFYDRDQKSYVLYYDDLYGIYENGKWVETTAENFSLHPVFDFGVLNELSESMLKKTSSGYVPRADNLSDVFFKLFNISEETRNDYEVYDLTLTLKNKRLENITASYVYTDNYVVEQTLIFSYNATQITVPEADEVYQENTD